MKLCFQDKTLRLSSNQNLILYEGDSNFSAQPKKHPILTPRWRVNKHGGPIFLLHFFNAHIMNGNYAKFQKKFDSGTISRELP